MAGKNYSASITVGGAIGASFRAAIGQAKSDILILGKSVKSLNTAQANIGKGKGIVDFDALKKAREEMRGAEEAAKKLGKAMAATKAPTAAMAKELAQAQHAAARAKSRYDSLRQSQLETVRAVKAATGSYRLHSDTVQKLGEASEKAASRIAILRTSGERIAKVGAAFKDAGSHVMRFGVIAVGAAAATAATIGSMAKGFAESSDDIAAMATKLGITTDALQQFRYIGKLNGASAEEMDTALGKLSARMAKAGIDGGAMAEDFAQVGLSLARLRSLGPEKAVIVIAEAMKKTNDPAKRLAIAMTAFGERAGPKLVPVLSEGASKLRELAKELRDMGGVLSPEELDKGNQLSDAWDRASESLNVLKNTIGSALGDATQSLLDEFTQWVKENRVQIGESARAFGEWAKKSGPEFFSAVKNAAIAVKDAAAAIGTVIDKTIGWSGAVYTFGAALGVVALGSLVTFTGKIIALGSAVWAGVSSAWAFVGGIGAIGRSIATVMLTVAGFGAAVSAAVGVAAGSVLYLGYTIWKYWDQMPVIINEAINKIGDAIGTAVDYYKSLFTGLFDSITGGFKSVANFASDTWNSALNVVGLGDGPASSKASPGGALAGTVLAGALAAPGAAIAVPPSASVPPAAVSSALGTAGTTTNNIVINGAPGQDAKAIAAEVMRRMKEEERARARGALND